MSILYINVVIVRQIIDFFQFIFSDLEGGRYFFNAVKEGDSILWACDDENECHLWVMALYRATGQAHKPTPLTSNTPKTAGLCKTQAGN